MRVVVLCVVAGAALAQTPNEYFLTGSGADVKKAVHPGVALLGGGKDVDAAFRWLIRKSGGGDVVVIRASGADGYNRYIAGLGKMDSVESIVIQTEEAAKSPVVLERIRNAEALFIAGGDQWNYVRLWGVSPMREVLQGLIDRGVPVGGTSAGMAVLGQYSFTAEHDTVTSAQALANPYDAHVTVGRDFVKIPILRDTITDTHFVKRDRLGRLLVFMARILQERKTGEVRAIAADERAAALVEPTGAVAIEGEGAVYFLRASAAPEVCRPGQPLTFRNVEAYRVKAGGSFDLRKWSGSGGTAYRLSVENGAVRSTLPDGAVY
jgi:cyanophycinase